MNTPGTYPLRNFDAAEAMPAGYLPYHSWAQDAYDAYWRVHCVTCDAEIPPGRAGRSCAACRVTAARAALERASE